MISILQKEVDKIRFLKYPEESDGDLSFYIHTELSPTGVMDEESDKILLTINHHGLVYSRVIFPKNNHLNYMPLKQEMEYLYGATM